VVKRILLLGALALGIGVTVRLTTAPAPAVAQAPVGREASPPPAAAAGPFVGGGDGRPRWQHLWTRPAPGLTSFSVAADGSAVAWVDDKGGVRRMDSSTGATLWQARPVAGLNRVLAAPGGRVVGYSRLNPALCALRVFDPAAGDRKAATLPVRGCVWSAALSGDGARALVGTGERLVYTVPLTPAAPAPATPAPKPAEPWRAPGIPDSLAVASDRPLAVLATWQGAGVRALDLKPAATAEKWGVLDPQPDRMFRVVVSADGSTAVAVSARGRRAEEARLEAWDARTGRSLFREPIEGRDPRVLVSADGGLVAVSYARMSYYRTGGDALEYKLALFDREGNHLFADKGSALFRPQLLALSGGADGAGRLTVYGGQGTLYTLDARGSFLSKLRLPDDPDTGDAPLVRDAVSSPDGRYLLLWRGDGQLSLFKATAS
jgi:hypothetical protein